jgi:hypothetical protein
LERRSDEVNERWLFNKKVVANDTKSATTWWSNVLYGRTLILRGEAFQRGVDFSSGI